MNRLLLVLAVLFALATVGSATAHATLPGEAAAPAPVATALQAEACLAAEPVQLVAALFKSCGKKNKAGLLSSCDSQKGVVLSSVYTAPPPALADPAIAPAASAVGCLGDPLFRPPRSLRQSA